MMNSSLIRRDDEIGGRFKVIEKIGEGGCGEVYEVQNLQDAQTYAMKVERTKLRRNDQLLKTEAFVLKKLQFSSHAPLFLCFDRTPNFRLLVMGLLGSSISDIRHDTPKRRFSVSTVLRIGLQALRAIWDLHQIYFVHRDIKPANFALGSHPNHRRLYLFDFGLARSILDPATMNARRLRCGRRSVAFRGTVAYCSPNVHKGLEHGRHDDLWSMLYMCIELIAGALPWSRLRRDKAFFVKEWIDDKYLLMGCPKKFELLLSYYRSLRYGDRPDYSALCGLFESCIAARKIRDSDPFDWEIDSSKTSKADLKSSYRINSSGKLTGFATSKQTAAVFPDEKRMVEILKHSVRTPSPTTSCSSSTSLSSPTIVSSLSPSRYGRLPQRDDSTTLSSVADGCDGLNSTQASSTLSSSSTASSSSSNTDTSQTSKQSPTTRMATKKMTAIRNGESTTALSSASRPSSVTPVID